MRIGFRNIMRRLLIAAVVVGGVVPPSSRASAQDTTRAGFIRDSLSRSVGTLRAGDAVRIAVFRDKELTGEYLIDSRGQLQIPGLGPKKIRALHDRLGITSIALLATACHEGRVAELDGFGEKTQEKILAGIKNRDYSVWMGWGFLFPPIVIYYAFLPRRDGALPRPRQPTLDELVRHHDKF